MEIIKLLSKLYLVKVKKATAHVTSFYANSDIPSLYSFCQRLFMILDFIEV